jgi:hypothetical protein
MKTLEWDSLSNQQFLRGDDGDDEDPEWDSYRKSIIRLFFYRYRRLDRTFSSSIIPALAGEFEI